MIVADDLPPSVAAQIDWTQTLGFITEVGSWTYHTAILARSLGVPAIVGVRDATERIAPGSEIILDGTTGEVFLDVDDAAEQEILRRRSERAIVAASYDTPRDRRADHARRRPRAARREPRAGRRPAPMR